MKIANQRQIELCKWAALQRFEQHGITAAAATQLFDSTIAKLQKASQYEGLEGAMNLTGETIKNMPGEARNLVQPGIDMAKDVGGKIQEGLGNLGNYMTDPVNQRNALAAGTGIAALYALWHRMEERKRAQGQPQ